MSKITEGKIQDGNSTHAKTKNGKKSPTVQSVYYFPGQYDSTKKDGGILGGYIIMSILLLLVSCCAFCILYILFN